MDGLPFLCCMCLCGPGFKGCLDTLNPDPSHLLFCGDRSRCQNGWLGLGYFGLSKNEGRFDFNLMEDKSWKSEKRIISCTMMIKMRICWRRMTMAVLTCMGWCRLVWGPVAVSELVGLVAACWCTPPPVCPQTCCTPPMLQAPVYPQTHRHTHSAPLSTRQKGKIYTR